jgi:hypothetical protein
VAGKLASTTHLLLRKSLRSVKLCLSFWDIHYRRALQNATLHRVFLLQELPLKINNCLRLLWVFYVSVL